MTVKKPKRKQVTNRVLLEALLHIRACDVEREKLWASALQQMDRKLEAILAQIIMKETQ